MRGVHCGKCKRAKQTGLIKGCPIYKRNKLVVENLGLVGRIAHQFRNCGAPRADIIQLGHEGLITAAERFNPDKEVKFTTYATWWIKARIRRGSAKYRNTPYLHKFEEISKTLNTFTFKFVSKTGRYPTSEEVVDNVTPKGWSASRVKAAYMYSCSTTIQGYDDIRFNRDLREYDFIYSPEELLKLKEGIFPKTLTKKEKIVVKSKIEGKSLQETAKSLCDNKHYECIPVSETVRRIERQALKKIERMNNA